MMMTMKAEKSIHRAAKHPADEMLRALAELTQWKQANEALWKGDSHLERGLRTAYLTLFARMEKLAEIYGAEI